MLTIVNVWNVKRFNYNGVWSCDKIHITDEEYQFYVDKKNELGELIYFSKITLHRHLNENGEYDLYTDWEKRIGIRSNQLGSVGGLVEFFNKLLKDE